MTDAKRPDSDSVGSNAWWAIIGPIPTPPSGGLLATPHDQGRALAQSVTVGPLQLADGGRALVEWLTCEPDTLFGVTKFVSWPIIVTGSAPGQRGEISYREGSRKLHRLVCLLALAWGEPWQERSAPGSPDAIPLRIPDSWPPPPFWRGSADADLGRSDEELPTWIPAVWDIITADQELAAAASFWHQGLLATARHPSLALVAYIASIEQTARWLESGGHLAKSKGARQRVDAAIALVASDGERMVLSPVYRIRSGTAHGAALHSTETVLGAYFSLNYMPGDPAAGSRPTLEPDLPDPLQVFTRQLHTAKTVAQRLIFVAFNSKLQEAVS